MEYISLSDYCLSVRDGTHDTPKPVEIGKPLVTSKAIDKNTIDFNQTYNISLQDFEKINKRSLVEKWDLLMTMIGSVGRLLLVKDNPDFAIKNVALFKIGNEQKAKWMYYYLSLKQVQDYFQLIANGTSQHFIPLKVLRKLKIENYSNQSFKIISILSKYDQLIENNNKRIKLLEQMAEELYKEWFVRFRFPGYKNTEFENGIPKSWRFAKLNDIALEVDKPINKENRYQYKYYVPIDCLPNKSMGLVDVDNIENAESSLITFQKKNILFGAMRPYFHKVIYSPIEGITRTTCFVLDAKNDLYREWLYLTMYQQFTVDFANTVSVGSTMPYVRWKDLNRMKVCIPSKDIIVRFNSFIQPILNKINSYFEINKNLIKQRDSLLPRLMSGKLSVEGKEII